MEKAVMSEAEVRTMIGIGRTTLYRLRQEGKFPAPINLGTRTLRFRKTDVEDWLSTTTRH